MDSSFEITSLFDQRPRARRGVSAYALSMLMHGAGIALGSWALIHLPAIREVPLGSRYAVRELKLHMPDHVPTGNERLYPSPVHPPAAKASAKAPAAQPAPPAKAPQEMAKSDALPHPPVPQQGGIDQQILLQPKLHIQDQLADKIPVPMTVMWMPELNQTKLIVPSKPTPAVMADVAPSMAEPNEELEMSDFSVSASDLQPKIPTPPPSTTSPLAQSGTDLVKLPPTTESDTPGQPTPTAVLSVSDVRMPDGIAVLPPVNETGTGSKIAGAGAPPAGNGVSAAAKPGGNGPGSGTGGAGNSSGAGVATASAASSTSAQAYGSETVDHIQLPPNGQFGVVVVGSSQTSQYPEAAQIWSDRIAYTVYLHVGLPRTWILQYGLLRTAQANGTGSVGRLDAPWPYDIFRPNLLATDVNADALMVHGVLNTSGKLEQLAVAFPEGYPHASFVVNALSRWQFRPAIQGGKPTSVEILLIIPEEDD